MIFKNRAFQVKVVNDKPKLFTDGEVTPTITMRPEYVAEVAKDVIITVGFVYVGARVATTICRVAESAARAYFR